MKKIWILITLALSWLFLLSSCKTSKGAMNLVQSGHFPDSHLSVMTLSELDGDWDVLQIGDVSVKDQKLYEQAVVGIDTKKNSIGGHLSCNAFSSPLRFSDQESTDYDPSWLDVEAIMSTRMMCENMTVEKALAKALSDADHFYKHNDGSLRLYASGKLVAILIRK